MSRDLIADDEEEELSAVTESAVRTERCRLPEVVLTS